MLTRLQKYNQEEAIFIPDKDHLLLAISGGVDSVVLAHLFQDWGVKFSLAHCNFKLRGRASDTDAKFVTKLAQQLNVAYYETSFETEKIAKIRQQSIQITARDLRYKWLEEIRKENGYQYIVTAHHGNDNIESLLLNLVHGAGVRGLHGILPKHPDHKIIRPLLYAAKAEIRAYAKVKNINFREDSSNASTKYTRNLLRHKVVPVLAQINPSLINTFNENFKHFREIEWLYQQAIQDLQKQLLHKSEQYIWRLNVSDLKTLPVAQSFLYELLVPYGFQGRQVAQIITHLEGTSTAIYKSSTHELLRSREQLILRALPLKKESEDRPIYLPNLPSLGEHLQLALPDGKRLDLQHYSIVDFQPKADPNIAYFDAALFQGVGRLRHWQKGDRFQPFGLGGQHKKLSSLFKDLKLSLLEKQQIWVLTIDEKIAWVLGLRSSEVFKVGSSCSTVIQLTFDFQAT